MSARRVLLSAVSSAVLSLAACNTDPLSAPDVAGPPSAMFGEDASGLLEVGVIEYRSIDGGLAVGLGVNQGLFTATQNGSAIFAVEVTLELSNSSGQTGSVGPTLKVLIDKLAEPRPDPLVGIEVVVPWNGSDNTGAAMTGATMIEYRVGIVRVNPNGFFDVWTELTGSMLIVIE